MQCCSKSKKLLKRFGYQKGGADRHLLWGGSPFALEGIMVQMICTAICTTICTTICAKYSWILDLRS